MYCIYAFFNLSQLYNAKQHGCTLSLLNRTETLYIVSLIPLFLYDHIFQYILGFHLKWPFLALMITSVHNSLGIIYCYIKYYSYFLKLKDINHKRKAY